MTPLRVAAAALALLVVAGCASVGPGPFPVSAPTATAFDAGGRLSARRGDEGIAVHFAWSHTKDSDRLDVSTPLGQVVARLSGDAAGVRVERPGEPTASVADWETLTRQVLGVAIPVDGLAMWIQGASVPRMAFDVERDAGGRPLVLRQQGWEIIYAYADDAAVRPMRLVMRYPDSAPVEVRIVVDRFATTGAIQ